METERISGIIKRYHSDRGWGLIYTYPPDGAIPVKWFFHFSQIRSGVPLIGHVASFIPGPPRSSADLATATCVEVGNKTAVRYAAVALATLVEGKDGHVNE
jgi:hypothetical protein